MQVNNVFRFDTTIVLVHILIHVWSTATRITLQKVGVINVDARGEKRGVLNLESYRAVSCGEE
jgi:hypothetical protein